MAIPTIIDTDIHPAPDPDRVAARLPEPWRGRYLSGNRGPGYLNYWNPNGVHRADAVTEEGERIEGSAVHLARGLAILTVLQVVIINPNVKNTFESGMVAGLAFGRSRSGSCSAGPARAFAAGGAVFLQP